MILRVIVALLRVERGVDKLGKALPISVYELVHDIRFYD